MNIYITQQNEEKLRQLEEYTMSGLINHLLYDYFKSHSIKSIKKKIESPEVKTILNANPGAADVILHPEKYITRDGYYELKEGAESPVIEGAPETPTPKVVTPKNIKKKFCKHDMAVGLCKFNCK